MATLTHPPHVLHAQTTTTPIHNTPLYQQSHLETRSTSAQPRSHDSDPHRPSPTPTVMDEPEIEERLYFAPPPLARVDTDSNMEGAEDTAGGRTPLAWLPQPQPFDRPNSPAHAMPATSVNIVDVPNAVDPPSPISEMLSSVRPPPPADLYPDTPPPPPALAPIPRTAAEDSEEEDDEDDDRSHISDERARSFYPFKEDTTVPDAEETRIMRAYVENSALDDKHWHSRTFFDLQDPELVPKEEGKIEWTIKDFNGTKETPRKNLLLTSHTVHIGGYDWRIKLLPHGNMHTDRLSLYVENVSVQSSAMEEWPADKLPLPVLGDAKVLRRKSVAAQVSVLVYNPEEPRVNEFRADASQFSQDSPDHGWTRFTSVPWYEIHRRSYAQRQPLLRNDTLAVKAFIRVIDDPTGYLWAPKDSQKLSLTGLIPFHHGYEDSALCPVLALWLHLRPFRQVLYQLGAVELFTKEDDSIITILQAILWRMRCRVVSPDGNGHVPFIGEFLEDFHEDKGPQDAMQTMDVIINDMAAKFEDHKDALAKLSQVFGADQFSGKRLTKRSLVGKTSMQEIVDEGLPKSLLQSEVLTLELERQVFDSEKRVWKKLLNKVRLDDQITVGDGATYTLYGFVAHEGHLRNGNYTSHFRPGGLGGLWYTYKQNMQPACQTRAQAVASKEGVYPPEAIEEPVVSSDRPVNYGRLLSQNDAVAYVVIYVRSSSTFDLSAKEPWDVPQWIPKMFGPETPAEITKGANDTFSYNDTASDNEDEEMNDATEGLVPTSTSPAAETLKQVTVNYLSQPYYHGTINAASEYHGTGHLIHLNGDEYTGTFTHSHRSQQGKMLYANLDTYDGQWNLGLPHGHGTHTSHRTGNTYTGNWDNGKKSGVGTMYFKCSEEETRLCRICFCEEANAAFYDCGHVVACVECARRVEDCPVCRRRVRDVIRLFYTA